jgi:hypothetical protein
VLKVRRCRVGHISSDQLVTSSFTCDLSSHIAYGFRRREQVVLAVVVWLYFVCNYWRQYGAALHGFCHRKNSVQEGCKSVKHHPVRSDPWLGFGSQDAGAPGCGCPPRVRASRKRICGLRRRPACIHQLFAGFAATRTAACCLSPC